VRTNLDLFWPPSSASVPLRRNNVKRGWFIVPEGGFLFSSSGMKSRRSFPTSWTSRPANLQPAPVHFCAAVELASIVPAAKVLRFRPPAPGGPTLPQPDGVKSLDSDGQYLHTWFCPVDPLPPSALALCPAVLAFFRLRFAPFLLSRQAEEDFWQDLGLQCRVPDTLRPLALYRLCSDELVKDSLGPASARVACVDAAEYLWAWQWTDVALEHGFPGDTGPWSGCGDT